jgi:amidase
MSLEPLSRTAGAAAAAIAAGEVSSRELTEAVLHRIDVVDPRLNAVVELRAEQALEEAARADGAEADGPLHGVPITVKEAFNVAGLHTTWGNPAFKDYVADWDATVVSRLREAGAVIIGKTNAHFMLADFAQTFNDVYGRTNNPWNLKLTPGGSSGGSAAAVSAAETFLDFGSDLVGSIRIPAAFCGIYGLKPSVGVVPLTGLQPPGPPAAPSEMSYMSNVGPFGRAAGDLRTALTATGGPEIPAFLPPDRYISSTRRADSRRTIRGRGKRVSPTNSASTPRRSSRSRLSAPPIGTPSITTWGTVRAPVRSSRSRSKSGSSSPHTSL